MAYKILFFFNFSEESKVKEIGEKLKEARESIGVSIDEASEDLKVKPSEIEEVEKGNIKALKDIFSLKGEFLNYIGSHIFPIIISFIFIFSGIILLIYTLAFWPTITLSLLSARPARLGANSTNTP